MASAHRAQYELNRAARAAGPDASAELIAKHYLAPDLAPVIGEQCSVRFLTQLAEAVDKATTGQLPASSLAIIEGQKYCAAASRTLDIRKTVSAVLTATVCVAIGFSVLGVTGAIFGLFVPGVILMFMVPAIIEWHFTQFSPQFKLCVEFGSQIRAMAMQETSFWSDCSWRELEERVAQLLRSCGFPTTLTPSTGDKGADVVFESEGSIFVVECKQHNKPIGPSIVRQTVGAMREHRANGAFVVSPSGFTAGAFDAARTDHVKLLSTYELCRIARNPDRFFHEI